MVHSDTHRSLGLLAAMAPKTLYLPGWYINPSPIRETLAVEFDIQPNPPPGTVIVILDRTNHRQSGYRGGYVLS